QFHPEVLHTERGIEILSNFVFGICRCKAEWKMGNYAEAMEKEIKETVKNGHALALVSGGIDSVLACLLAGKALGKRLHAIHMDTGLLRKDESRLVKQSLQKLGIGLEVVDCSQAFLAALADVHEPEEKRKIIGDLFVKAFEAEVGKLGLDIGKTYLVQGTLYTDLIESGKGSGDKADKIKTHHNVASPLIEKLRQEGRVIEPNRDIFKDEVRKLSAMLGIPKGVYSRHPFPGPGLGVRIISNLGYVGDWKKGIEDCRKIAKEHGFEIAVLPVKSVGVQGDARTYRNVAMLTGKQDWKGMRKACERMVKTTRQVNRVVYVLQAEQEIPQRSAERLCQLSLGKEHLDLLREADSIANSVLAESGLYDRVSQMPVVLFPGISRPWVCIRDVATEDFMTARPLEKPGEMPWACLQEMAEKIMASKEIEALGGVEGVCIDITDKPPATIEWE
ncbi:MAG: glutamine-hydrolyzing GMP synthase, partial [Candidatus Aenigmarchaeota archaeon]|nr:glutamine-hydrolyzing GMP synthase [Candidatus Aenigmarchaeota archaeon]